RTGEQLRELKLERDQGYLVPAVSSDGKTAVSWGINDGIIRLWDVATGNQLRSLQGNEKSSGSFFFTSFGSQFFSPGNEMLASFGLIADGDDKKVGKDDKVAKMVQLWDVSSGKLLQELVHPQLVTTVTFSPDSKMLASGGNDKAKQLWAPERTGPCPSAVRL